MAITTQDGLIAALAAGQNLPFWESSFATAVGLFYSNWLSTGEPGAGAVPGSVAGVVPTSASGGALPFTNPTGGITSYLARLVIAGTVTSTVILYDRLVHSDGLSGTSVATQNVNTPAITRPDANGDDVEAWLEWYTATGATQATATIVYTNSVGTSGRSTTVTIPASTAAQRMIPIPLLAGDVGVRSVQSVTLSISTGTAGNFGITLLRRIVTSIIPAVGVGSAQNAIQLGLPVLFDNACLATMVLAAATTSGTVLGEGLVIQG